MSLLLIAGSIVLLGAIILGNSMGNKVLGQITSRASISTTPVPIPTASAGDETAAEVISRRHQVLSVATDPGFPDPRITPEPPPPETPRPSPKPSPTPTFDDGGDPTPLPTDTFGYTSPPLLVPIASHPPDETSPPDENGSPRPSESQAPHSSRSLPSLPPATSPP